MLATLDNLIQERVHKATIKHLHLEVSNEQGNLREIPGFINPQLPQIIAAIQSNIPVCFIGGSGTGKTTLAKQLSEVLELPFYCQTVTAGMDEAMLLGGLNPKPDGGFEYTSTPFLTAVEHGGLMLLDEFDAIDENAALAINNILEFGELDLPMRSANPKLIAHPNFRLIACANTNLTGATLIHSGRNQLDGATISRFDGGIFHIGYEPELEILLAPNTKVRTAFLELRKTVKTHQINREISTRTLKRAELLWNTAKWNTLEDLIHHFIKTWSEDEKNQLQDFFHQNEEELQYSQAKEKAKKKAQQIGLDQQQKALGEDSNQKTSDEGDQPKNPRNHGNEITDVQVDGDTVHLSE